MNSISDNLKKKAVFLDRDGVINHRIVDGYITNSAQFVFEHKAIDAVNILSKVFDFVFVVTNQQGIGRGLMTHDDLFGVHQHMLQQIEQSGGRIDSIFYCPHLAAENCSCRKPNIGMYEQALIKFSSVDTLQSYMVGDTITDLQFGRNVGLKTVLISQKVLTEIEILKLADEQYSCLYSFAKQFL
jgi:D-glycero-D-manno-heptose 1,7-bisphosphate phosphatase